MTAGLFAKHGVWFGDCIKPNRINRKGFFENASLKRLWAGQERPNDFPAWWASERVRQGHAGGAWGAKSGSERWAQYWVNVEDVSAIVLCYRDKADIEASRKKAGFNKNNATAWNWAKMKKIEPDPRAVTVWTPNFIKGDFSEIIPAFEKIGVEFSEDIARAWVDPDLWHGRA